MRKLTVFFVASTLALGAANLAHAADITANTDTSTITHHKAPRGIIHETMFKNLNLTDAQKQQIHAMMKEQRSKIERPSGENRRAMHNLIASDSFDKTKAQDQVEKMMEQNNARMMAYFEMQNKIYNILTPEQKKQFNANFEKRMTERSMHEDKMSVE